MKTKIKKNSKMKQNMLTLWLSNLPWKEIWQRVPGVAALCLIPFAIYGPKYTPVLFSVYYVLLHVLFLINNIRSCYGIYIASRNTQICSMTDWEAKYCHETGSINTFDAAHDLPFDSVAHIIILPNYKESLDTLCETLDVLASHRRALTQYKVFIHLSFDFDYHYKGMSSYGRI